MEEIVSQYGVVVCTRSGSNIERFIYESDLLSKYKVSYIVKNMIKLFIYKNFKNLINVLSLTHDCVSEMAWF